MIIKNKRTLHFFLYVVFLTKFIFVSYVFSGEYKEVYTIKNVINILRVCSGYEENDVLLEQSKYVSLKEAILYLQIISGVKVIIPKRPIINRTNIFDTSIFIMWDSIAYADYYTLYFSINEDFSNAVSIENITNTEYLLSNLETNQNYYFYVTASNSAGESDKSEKKYAYTSHDFLKIIRGSNQENLRDTANIIEITNDGGYIIVFDSKSYGLGTYDHALLKFSNESKLEWVKTFGTNEYDEYGIHVKESISGGYITVSYEGQCCFSNKRAILLRKHTSTGAKRNEYKYTFPHSARVNSLIELNDGTVIIVGDFYKKHSTADTNRDIFILKINIMGNIQWYKTYSSPGNDLVNEIIKSKDGFLVVGSTDAYNYDNNSDIWLLSFDIDGKLNWQKKYGLNGSEDSGKAIIQTSDNNYIVVGMTKSFGSGNSDAWILKLNQQGNILWQKAYGTELNETANSIAECNNDFVVTGIKNDNIWLFKIDSNGNIIWEKEYGGDKYDTSYAVKNYDEGFILFGITRSKFESIEDNSDNLFLLKVNKSGELPHDSRYCPFFTNSIAIETTVNLQYSDAKSTSDLITATSTVPNIDATIEFSPDIAYFDPFVIIDTSIQFCDNNHLYFCDSSNCHINGGFWYNSTCNSEEEPKPQCSPQNLSLCNDLTSCETVSGHWYNNKCNSIPEPPKCSSQNLSLCNDLTSCETVSGHWYNDKCNSIPEPKCSSQNLSLCNDLTSCETVGGDWYNNKCNENQQVLCSYENIDKCIEEDSCISVGGIWQNNKCLKPNVCNIDHLDLCYTQEDCINNEGFWNDNFCQKQESENQD